MIRTTIETRKSPHRTFFVGNFSDAVVAHAAAEKEAIKKGGGFKLSFEKIDNEEEVFQL